MDRFVLGMLTGMASLIAPLIVASLSLPLLVPSQPDATTQVPQARSQDANDPQWAQNRAANAASPQAVPGQNAAPSERTSQAPTPQTSGIGTDMAERTFSRQGFSMALPTDWPDTTDADKARLAGGSGVFSTGNQGLLLSSMTILKPDGNIEAQLAVLFGRPRFDDPLAVADRRQQQELERYRTAKIVRRPSRIDVNGLRGAEATTRITSKGSVGRVTNTFRLTVLYVGRNALLISSVAKTGSKAESQIERAIASVRETR